MVCSATLALAAFCWDLDSLARGLPSSRGAWSLLETAEPAAIVDRIEGAGLYPSQPGRFSMRGESWTQNTVLFDGVDVTDPLRGGTPLFLPDPDGLRAIEITSGLAPAEYAAPGVTLAFAPREPSPVWQGTAQAYGLGAGRQSAPTPVPAIARFGSLADVGALASGPVAGGRLRLLASGRGLRARRFERADPAALESSVVTGSLQLAYRAGERDHLRLLALAQQADRPLAARARFAGQAPRERDRAQGAVASWAHQGSGASASVHAGLWSAALTPVTAGRLPEATVERLRDGPVPELAFPARSQRSSASLEARVAISASTRFGMSLERAWSAERRGRDGPIAEAVDGLAARVWEYAWAGPDSRRHALDLAAWASQRLVWRGRVTLDAGLRLERTTGRAQDAIEGVSWTSLLPRVSGRLRLTDAGGLSLLGGWGRYRHRLRLDHLAFGDPNAAQASVYRWADASGDGLYQPAERGPRVARVGPGAGAGDGSLAGIDPGLRSPRTRELVAGLEARPREGWVLSLTGFDRRQADLLESVDVGVPASAYSVRYLMDPGGDLAGPQDDQQLPVFERRAESFGLDRYLLLNAPGHDGRHQGVELRVARTLGPRFGLSAGATASRTEVRGGNRGFRVSENDQGVVGELFDQPNADTFSRGRGFFDRAYTLKLAGAWRAPGEVRLGMVARYQDGQPFGRLVVVPDLAQGPEAVPATPRGQPGGHRFSYTLTVDARLEKGLALGRPRLSLVADVFNLLGLQREVEENVVGGPRFRVPTARQPPRAVRFGARLGF